MDIKGKNILVTGADGFIGSHLVEILVKNGANVRALSYYNSFNFWGWLENIPCQKDIEIISGDIRDPFLCNKIAKKIDVVFNLAALIGIPYSYIAPDSYIETNIKGTVNICQAALENKCEKVIHTSTSEVYGTAQYVPIDEKHPLQPQSPYSASKIAADSMAMSFYNSFSLPVAIARPFNTFGPRQSARAVIPTIITQIFNNAKKIKLGDVSTSRDFTFVEDTCAGFLAIAQSDKSVGEIINIGSGRDISIQDLFNQIKELTNSDIALVEDKERVRPPKSEVQRLLCNNNKIKNLTNFSLKYDLKQGLLKTIDWFKNPNNLTKYKSDIYNV